MCRATSGRKPCRKSGTSSSRRPGDAVSFNAYDQRLFAILGQLSVAEHEAGRPLLSVLVVHKHGDMKPGEGFFELAGALGRKTSDVLKAWITEVQKVYQEGNR